VRTDFAIVKGVSLSPKWEVTRKVVVYVLADYGVWDYRSDGISGEQLTNRRRDHVSRAMAGMTYQMNRIVTLDLQFQHQNRTSNILFADYRSTAVTFSVKVTL